MVCLLGWEKYALDKNGKRYIKERWIFPASGIMCRNIYLEVKDDYAIIYDIDETKKKIELCKIYLEEGEVINVTSEHMD